jgi:hypothetical protein
MVKRPELLELGNHARILRILKNHSGTSNMTWYDNAVLNVARPWLLLAAQHLRVAQQLCAEPRVWRAVISRSYYAAYNSSRSVRYLIKGFVKLDASDHQEVGDLPDDFPKRAAWSTFLTETRKDRNIADYEPWTGVRSTLSRTPNTTFELAEEFLREAKTYLRAKGFKV